VLLGIGAHHLHARAFERLALLLRERGPRHARFDVRAPPGLRDRAVVAHADDVLILERVQHGREPRLGDVDLLEQATGLDWAAVGVDAAGDAVEHVGLEAPGGEEAPAAEVLGAVEEHGPRGLTVAPGAPELLVVGVDGLGDVVVDDEAHVVLVDAHAERDRRDDDVDPGAGHERLLDGVAALHREPGVVGRRAHGALVQGGRHLLRRPLRRGVDDARRLGVGDPIEQRPLLVLGVEEALDREVDVRSVEAAHDDRRIAEPEALDDLGSHRRRRGRGEREHGRAPERVGDVPEPQVIGAEVVAPLRDAVRLVDAEERRLRRREALDDLGVGELLGSEEHELDRALLQAGPDLVALMAPERRVQRHRVQLAVRAVLDGLELVLLERDQRRHDDRRARPQQAGELVDRRLARSRGHDAERVAPVEDRLDALELAGSQRAEPEVPARRRSDLLRTGHSAHATRSYPRSGWPPRRHPRGVAPGWPSSAARCPTARASTSSATPNGASSTWARRSRSASASPATSRVP
jgi:hypothetical protein